MQYFQDTANPGHFYAYEDGVTVAIVNGVSTVTIEGEDGQPVPINAPTTLVASGPPPAPEVTPAQVAAEALAAGIQIASSANPAINGTYAIDATAQSKIMATDLYITKRGSFYGGAVEYPWLDIDGQPHTFSMAEFDAFAAAVGDYVAGLDAVTSGQSITLPALPIALD